MFYLVVALVWLALALWIFLFPDLLPAPLRRIPFTGVSVGWFCMLLFVWRMYGWWQWRTAQRHQLLRQNPRQRAGADGEYHPEFDFDDPPPERDKHD